MTTRAHICMPTEAGIADIAPPRPPVTYTVHDTARMGPGREFLNRAAANDWAAYRTAMTGSRHDVCEVYHD